MATVPKQQEPEASPPSPLPFGEKTFVGEKKAAAKSEGEAQRESGAEVLLVRSGLTLEQKKFIVESFACFQGISAITAEAKRRWGLQLDPRHVASFDPRRPMCRCGKALKLYYAQCRKAYVEGVAEVAISHQAHRLRLLGRVIEKANNSKDFNAAIKGLELAAKEMGGALTSQHTVKHEGVIGHVHATVEEAKAEIAARLTQVIDGGHLLSVLPAAPPTEGAGE